MIKLALIGIGRWGNNFLETVEKMDSCEISFLVAKSKKTLSKFSEKYRKSTNIVDLFDNADIDGIIIASPGSTHYSIARQCIEKKIPVLIEKPLTLHYREALELKKLAKKTKTFVMAGHVYLYNSAYKKVKKLISKIGKINYLSFKGYNYGPFRDDMSALWEWAPHGISIGIDLLNSMPRTVSAWAVKTLREGTNLYDIIFLRLTFDNNITCLLECGWLYPIKRRELLIYGSKSSIILDDLAEKKITFFKNLGPTIVNKKIKEKLPVISYPQYEPTMPLELEIMEFINAIKKNKRPTANIDHAVEVIKIIEAAEKSLKNNGKILNLSYEKEDS